MMPGGGILHLLTVVCMSFILVCDSWVKDDNDSSKDTVLTTHCWPNSQLLRSCKIVAQKGASLCNKSCCTYAGEIMLLWDSCSNQFGCHHEDWSSHFGETPVQAFLNLEEVSKIMPHFHWNPNCSHYIMKRLVAICTLL
jgi:hypothetical protein